MRFATMRFLTQLALAGPALVDCFLLGSVPAAVVATPEESRRFQSAPLLHSSQGAGGRVRRGAEKLQMAASGEGEDYVAEPEQPPLVEGESSPGLLTVDDDVKVLIVPVVTCPPPPPEAPSKELEGEIDAAKRSGDCQEKFLEEGRALLQGLLVQKMGKQPGRVFLWRFPEVLGGGLGRA